jgi:hypothetical protein
MNVMHETPSEFLRQRFSWDRSRPGSKSGEELTHEVTSAAKKAIETYYSESLPIGPELPDVWDFYEEMAFDVCRLAKNLGIYGIQMTWLSYGGGTQTSVLYALGAEHYRFEPGKPGYIPFDLAVFSNVGDFGTPAEWPETMVYAQQLQYLGMVPIWLLQPSDWNRYLHGDSGGLFDRYFARETMPVRMLRSCTDHFKIKPQVEFLKAFHDFCAMNGVDVHVKQIIGYSQGEEARAERFDPEYDFITGVFPLIEWGWNREMTIGMFAANMPQWANVIGLPKKSGCWFCPFQKRGKFDPVTLDPTPRSWLALHQEHPELFWASVAMEERQNIRRASIGKNPIYLYGTRPLRDWVGSKYLWVQTGFSGIADYEEGELATDDTCSSWGCFR